MADDQAFNPERRLVELNIELPEVPRPIANFVPWQRHGELIFLAGLVCEWNGEVVYAGKVGREIDLETAKLAARICMLNVVAALREALGGDLSRVQSCLRLGGFVNCMAEFPSVPQVINGASDLCLSLFGGVVGAHARTSVGVAQLPRNAAVEVDAVVEIA